jgi:hypothetical protein
MSSTGPPPLTTATALPFEPMELTFSATANKLYVSGLEGEPPRMRAYVVSLSAPTGPIERFDTAIHNLPEHIVVNDKLRRGYALVASGAIKVFSTDSDTLVSTSQEPSCHAEVLAISQTSGLVYGGGLSDKGECLVQFDSGGRIVRDNVVAPPVKGKNLVVQRIAVDAASGDVLYTNPFSVGRADQTLTEKWRTPVPGAGGPSNTVFPSQGQANDMGFEPTSGTVYISVCGAGVIDPATIAIFDGRTGKQTGQFIGPGSSSQFAADHDGRLFAAFFNSADVFVLPNGAATPTKFATLPDIAELSADSPKWLAVDAAQHRLFVSGGKGHSIYLYSF